LAQIRTGPHREARVSEVRPFLRAALFFASDLSESLVVSENTLTVEKQGLATAPAGRA
jgi:hypothetical protein